VHTLFNPFPLPPQSDRTAGKGAFRRPKPANMAQKCPLAFHFLFSKRSFLVLMGVSKDLATAVFLIPPEPVKRINTGNSEIVVMHCGVIKKEELFANLPNFA
jgi:hypothetical protein